MLIQIRKFDIKNLSFGSKIFLTTLNGEDKKAVVINGGIALKNGDFIKFENIEAKQVFLGWS